MNNQLIVKRVGNHWYPCVNHIRGYIDGFDEKIDRYLSILDIANLGELTIEFENIGVEFNGINIIYFNEQDITRYLTTDDVFDLRFVINNHEFTIYSDIYWLLETQFNFNFHKESYRIHIY
jgi:hypothetical protein